MQFLIPTSHPVKLIWLLSILTFSLPAWSVDLAAHVILAKGQVTAVNSSGESRALKRRSKIFNGDIIKTGANGSVQLRFIDKALMTIKANSEMDIANYQKGSNGKEEKAIMNLVKGGFRTITGQIGKGDKSAYKVTTPAASIGIRGTNYEVQQESDGGFVMAVYSGGISVQNDSGTLDLGLGSDFNFVRVSSSGSAPEGLLSAPESLSENAATEESSESATEEEKSEESSEGDETASTESEEGTDDESSNEGSDGDSDGKTVAANDTSGDGSASESSDDSESENPIDQAITAIQEEMGDLDEGTEEALGDIAAALDSQLIEQIEEDSATLEEELTQDLVEAGYLTDGETLSDLDPTVKENLENLGSIEDFEAALAEETDLTEEGIIPDPDDGTEPSPEPDPTFASPSEYIAYLYSDLATVANPFELLFSPEAVTNQEYNLIASEKLAVLAIPLGYTMSADGSPNFDFNEAQVGSPTTIPVFDPYDFTLDPTTIAVNYQITDFSSGQPVETKYELRIPVDISVGNTIDIEYILDGAINSGFVESSYPLELYIDGVQQTLDGSTPIYGIQFVPTYAEDGVTMTGFTIQPTSGSSEFVNKMELQVHGGSPTSEAALNTMLGGTGAHDEWYASTDTELVINSGAWQVANSDGSGSPILYFERTDTEFDPESQMDQEYTTIEAVNKPYNADETVSSLLGLASCGQNGLICDIAVNTVKASQRIRWGAWLAEPGEGINIYNVSENTSGSYDSSTHTDDQILAFWLAAERADISELIGTAQFTSTNNTDCTDFSQCIGFADDGVVHSVTGQFNVNFDSALISDGQLNIKVTDDASNLTTISEWDVNFSGSLDPNRPSDFATNNVSGVVKDGAGNLVSNKVIGNVGGIFVKPGDTFAGGYNVGAITQDGTNKHAAGVFTLEKVEGP